MMQILEILPKLISHVVKELKDLELKDVLILALLSSLIVPIYIIYKVTDTMSDPSKLEKYIHFSNDQRKTRVIGSINSCLNLSTYGVTGEQVNLIIYQSDEFIGSFYIYDVKTESDRKSLNDICFKLKQHSK